MTTTMWILGFIAGLAALVIMDCMFLLGIAAVVVVALLRPRPAAAAGVAWGAGFLIVLWQAAERCAVFNRQPNASCTSGDNSPFAILGIAVLALGLLLTVYTVRRARGIAAASSP